PIFDLRVSKRYREVGHENFVADYHGARREQQPVRRPVAVDTAELAELGDNPAVLVQSDDLVGLVGADPQQATPLVEDDAVGAVEALGEDSDLSRPHVERKHPVVAGIGDEKHGLARVERESVGAERRETGRGEKRIVTEGVDETGLRTVRYVGDVEDGTLERVGE